MAIDWNDEIVDQLEWHWQHQLRPRLDGLTDDEYLWPPVPGPRFPGTAAEALRRLDEGHDAWLADVRLLGADGLLRDLHREKFR
jgi:hypothetical protein